MVATRYRGTLVSVLNIGSGGVGNFVSYGLFFLLLGPLAAGLGGDDLVWRWTFAFLALPALLVVLLPAQAARVAPLPAVPGSSG